MPASNSPKPGRERLSPAEEAGEYLASLLLLAVTGFMNSERIVLFFSTFLLQVMVGRVKTRYRLHILVAQKLHDL